jgi:hypothetical protein
MRVSYGYMRKQTIGRMRAALIVMLLLVAGCVTVGDRGQALIPTRYRKETGQFIIFSNVPLQENPPEVRCLQALERDLEKELHFQAPAGVDPVEIYVLDNRDAFSHFLKFYYPELPPRRAFFLAQGSQRVVYTYSNPRLEEDLRHEATHALLRGAYGDLPLWLDEGLAEYFENDVTDAKSEKKRLELLTEDLALGWAPDLLRLEGLNDIRQMSPRDYREAWAWSHLMLRGAPGDFGQLQDYLNGLRAHRDQPKISARLVKTGPSSVRLLAHLKNPPAAPVATKPAPAESPVRLQDAATEPLMPNPPARSFWRKMTGWLGLSG